MCTRLLESQPSAIPVAHVPANPGGRATALSFVEEMWGFLGFGQTDPRAREGRTGGDRFAFRLTITADDVNRFLSEPEARAKWLAARLEPLADH